MLSTPQGLTFGSVNIAGLKGVNSKLKIQKIKNHNLDIVAIQESGSKNRIINNLEKN